MMYDASQSARVAELWNVIQSVFVLVRDMARASGFNLFMGLVLALILMGLSYRIIKGFLTKGA